MPDAPVSGAAAIASMSAGSTTIRAGDKSHVTITLDGPAPAGGQLVDLDVADASVLGAPSALMVPAGATSIDVDVVGKRPSRAVRITATTAMTSKHVSISVTGLQLSEIEFDAVSTDDGYEWIKLANTTDVAIDLAPYSIGSGRTSYQYSIAQLTGTIPAHGCFVIGGPLGSPTYEQTFNFSPDLLNGSGTNGQAAGFALFDVPVTQLESSRIPLDAVLCGQNNAAGLLNAAGAPATPNCPDVAAGHSVARQSATTWIDRATPTPNACP
jgi:hypothetical protein